MTNLSCVIVDDEEHAIEHLKRLIDKTGKFSILKTYTDPVKALHDLNDKLVVPDVIFLDVEMSDLSGIQFINLLEIRVLTVFCTGYPNFGAASYETEAVDFLVKPVSIERFQKMYTRVIRKLETVKPVTRTSIFIETDKGKLVHIPFEDIIFVKADGNYINIQMKEKHFLTYMSLSEAEQLLPLPIFTRVHRSFLINLNQIESVDNDTIQFYGNHKVPIGVSYKQIFLDKLDIFRKRR